MSDDQGDLINQGDLDWVVIVLTGGDWAATLGDAEVLAEVCRQLYPCVAPKFQDEVAAVNRLVYWDWDAAKERWAKLSAHLRAHVILHSAPSNVEGWKN